MALDRRNATVQEPWRRHHGMVVVLKAALMLAMIFALAVAAGPNSAACTVPPGLTPAPANEIGEKRLLPVTKMVLAYYWWPENCQYPGGDKQGCDAGFGFKVHGLWPDSVGKTYPQFCRLPTQLTPDQVRANFCMIPSTTLLQHEWVKHGTCHWPSPEAYFGDTRRIADSIVMPDAASLPGEGLTAGKLRDAIVARNPQLSRDGLFVGTNKKQWLTEAWVCLTTDYAPMRCEDGNIGAPDPVPIRVRRR